MLKFLNELVQQYFLYIMGIFVKFELYIMSMEYPNAFKHNVANVFIVYRTFLKTWNDLKVKFLWEFFSCTPLYYSIMQHILGCED
jgi:hypothetical protein